MPNVLIQDAETLQEVTYANRAFVPLAVEAGILTVINSLTTLAKSEGDLLLALKEALIASNPPLAAALTSETLAAIMDYASTVNNSVLPAANLPEMLNENGPASVSAGRDGGAPTQINITFSAPPNGYTYELYLDGVFAKAGSNAPTSGFVNDYISNVPPGSHTVRVLFVNADGDITRFGPVADIS